MTKKKRTDAAILTLGPVLFNWPVEKWRDFYFRIADEAPVDTVVVGETVCEKRLPFFAPHFPDVIERLQRGGKEVVFATLGLIANERERAATRDAVNMDDLLIEANDITAVAELAGRPHAIGPMVNVYNEGTLEFLAGQGACRVCLPPELPGKSVAALTLAAAIELEVQVFGRLPLAISTRCYHARSRNLSKDGCLYVCAEDPDGMIIETIDDEPFLAVNGTQTMSLSYVNLMRELQGLKALGVRRFRLSPQDIDMVAVATLFREALEGTESVSMANVALAMLCEGTAFSNGFFHGHEGRIQVGRSSAVE